MIVSGLTFSKGTITYCTMMIIVIAAFWVGSKGVACSVLRWLDESGSFHVRYCSTVRYLIMAPV